MPVNEVHCVTLRCKTQHQSSKDKNEQPDNQISEPFPHSIYHQQNIFRMLTLLQYLGAPCTPTTSKDLRNSAWILSWAAPSKQRLKNPFETTDCSPHGEDIDSLTHCITGFTSALYPQRHWRKELSVCYPSTMSSHLQSCWRCDECQHCSPWSVQDRNHPQWPGQDTEL